MQQRQPAVLFSSPSTLVMKVSSLKCQSQDSLTNIADLPGGAPITIWIWRACWIQSLQHAYTLALWFWGSFISSSSASGKSTFRLPALPILFPITLVITLCLWSVGIVLFIGLPSYYRQMPDQVPSLLRSIMKRKITLWFFVAVLLQNYFLSAPYGRNWFFLFSSQHISTRVILGLAFGFLVCGWGLCLSWFAFISRRPWWLPIFAIGLGAPRWAQMLWGTSSFGLFLPWAGSDVASALVSRCLWL
jgi:alpha-1,3-glucan synthase